MTKELWKGAKQRSCLGAYSKEWSGDPTSEKIAMCAEGGASTKFGPAKYPSMDDLAHDPGPTPNKYVRNQLRPAGLGQDFEKYGDPQNSAGTDNVIQKWHGRGGFSGADMGRDTHHPKKGSDRRTSKGGVGGETRPGSGKLFTAGGDPVRKARGGQGTDAKSSPKGSHKYSWR